MSQSDEVEILVAAVGERLGGQSAWARFPGGWPGDLESALIDAVYSARAVYKTTGGGGVHSRVVTWQAGRRRSTFTATALRGEIDRSGPEDWAKAFGNSQLSPGRPAYAPGGATKAAAIRQACEALLGAKVDTATDIVDGNVADVKAALRSVPGIGYATVNYFLILLGRPGVKPDRMVLLFVREALGDDTIGVKAADRLVTEAAGKLRFEPHELDHAIWRYESDRAAIRE